MLKKHIFWENFKEKMRFEDEHLIFEIVNESQYTHPPPPHTHKNIVQATVERNTPIPLLLYFFKWFVNLTCIFNNRETHLIHSLCLIKDQLNILDFISEI